MPGIRLHHASLRNCTVAVECARGYAQPYNCPLCNVTHRYKTVHLTLDAEGDVIVSSTPKGRSVWDDIKDVPNLPFTYANDVKKPPALILAMNGNSGLDTTELHAHPFEGRR